MNVWKEETVRWRSYRDHTVTCPQCRNSTMCDYGLQLEKAWGEAHEAMIRAEQAGETEMELDFANEPALPPEWLDDHADDFRPGSDLQP